MLLSAELRPRLIRIVLRGFPVSSSSWAVRSGVDVLRGWRAGPVEGLSGCLMSGADARCPIRTRRRGHHPRPRLVVGVRQRARVEADRVMDLVLAYAPPLHHALIPQLLPPP